MGYTHYHYYKNPAIEMMQAKAKKDKIREENRGNWQKISSEWEKVPTHESFLKRIQKHINGFAKASEEIELAIENLPAGVVIRGGQGKGEPEITPTRIWFNGDASQDLDHETFGVELFEMGSFQSFEDIDKDGAFGFCKTARKPYDLLVCVSLMILKHNLGADLTVSSDGSYSHWANAIEFYENLFKRKAPKQLVNYLKKEEQTA